MDSPDTQHHENALNQAVFVLVRHPLIASDKTSPEPRWAVVRDFAMSKEEAAEKNVDMTKRPRTKWKFPGGGREDVKLMILRLKRSDREKFDKMKRYIRWAKKMRPPEFQRFIGLPEKIREFLAGTIEVFEETGLFLNPFNGAQKLLEYHFANGHIKTFFEGSPPIDFKLNASGTDIELVGDKDETFAIQWMTRNDLDSEALYKHVIPDHYAAFQIAISPPEKLPVYVCSIENCKRCAEENVEPSQRIARSQTAPVRS